MWKYILKYLILLNRILTDLERAKATISREKSQFYIVVIKIIGFLYNREGQYPNLTKVLKILN